jgi:VWFA-related protein
LKSRSRLELSLLPLLAFICVAQQSSVTQQSSAAPAQVQVPTFTAATRLVVLDVVVTDKQGKPVRNLTKEDFTVLEDGTEQMIASFEPPNQHAPAPVEQNVKAAKGSKNSTARSLTASAVTILVLDELNTPVFTFNREMPMTYARNAIRKYLKVHGPRLEEPTALMAVGEKQLVLLHDYTSDADELDRALRHYPMHLPFRLLSGEGPEGASARLTTALEVLKEIAAANADFAGRKNVIWIGPGFPSLNYSTAPPSAKLKLMGYVRETSDLMWKGRLSVYTVDPTGLEIVHENIGMNTLDNSFVSPPDTPTGDLLFEQIAPQTGGRIFRGLNDLDAQIATSVSDGDAYYALSYYPTNHKWDGVYRKIRVAMRNPDLIARTRNGYYADQDFQPTSQDMDRLLSRAVINPLSYHALAVEASAKLSGSGERTANITVDIDTNALHWETPGPGKRRCEMTVVTAGFTLKGQVVAHAVKELEVVVDEKKYEELCKKGMVMNLAMALPPAAVRMRVVARDSTNGNMGTADLTPEGAQFH